MTDTPLIRREVIADRGPLHISTDEIYTAICNIKGESFTVREIANVIQRKRRGVQKQRIANAVKTGVSWLVAREAVEVSGSIRVRSRKQQKLCYLVTTYKLTRHPVVSDFALLYKALGLNPSHGSATREASG